jgi:hypothetical protein
MPSTSDATEAVEAIAAEIAALSEKMAGATALEGVSEDTRAASEVLWKSKLASVERRIADAQAVLALARGRDAVQATRPEGCRCLGLGGWGAFLPMKAPSLTPDVPDEWVIYWQHYCHEDLRPIEYDEFGREAGRAPCPHGPGDCRSCPEGLALVERLDAEARRVDERLARQAIERDAEEAKLDRARRVC